MSERIEEILRGAGLTDRPDEYGDGIHGWRCEHPDRYGRCECFSELVDDLAERDRQVAERAWDEGLDAQKDYAWRCEDADAAGQGVWVRPPESPYRAVKGEDSDA